MIKVPDSVAFYWGDGINRAAVDVLVESATVPDDLSLAEAEHFELAALAARRIQVEYWTLLRALWSATWGDAIKTHFPRAKLLGYGGHMAFATEVAEPYVDPSIAAAWVNDGVSGVYEVPGQGRLYTALWLTEGEAEVQLQFYLLDTDGAFAASDGLDLGSDWEDDGESRRQTVSGRLPFSRTDANLDPSKIAACAHEAVTALARALEES